MDGRTMVSPASGLDQGQQALLRARLEEERDTLTRRLKERRLRTSRWAPGSNPVDHLLGRGFRLPLRHLRTRA